MLTILGGVQMGKIKVDLDRPEVGGEVDPRIVPWATAEAVGHGGSGGLAVSF